jgi:hypothetical protein
MKSFSIHVVYGIPSAWITPRKPSVVTLSLFFYGADIFNITTLVVPILFSWFFKFKKVSLKDKVNRKN